MKNILISFIKEYRADFGATYDVVDDVITVKTPFLAKIGTIF